MREEVPATLKVNVNAHNTTTLHTIHYILRTTHVVPLTLSHRAGQALTLWQISSLYYTGKEASGKKLFACFSLEDQQKNKKQDLGDRANLT